MHIPPPALTLEEIRRRIDTGLVYTLLYGRAIRVDLSKEEFDPEPYNHDNGAGRAEQAISQLRAKVGVGIVPGLLTFLSSLNVPGRQVDGL